MSCDTCLDTHRTGGGPSLYNPCGCVCHAVGSRVRDPVRDPVEMALTVLSTSADTSVRERTLARAVLAWAPVIAATEDMRKGHEGCVTDPPCGSCFRCDFDRAVDAMVKDYTQ